MGMLQTKSIKMENAVSELYELNQRLKELEKRSKELKEHVRAFMGDSNVLTVGIFLVVINERSRSDLDRDALMKRLEDEYDDYLKTTEYTTLEVKRVK